jgi:hypothetical protein
MIHDEQPSNWRRTRLGPAEFTTTVEAEGDERFIRIKGPPEFQGRRFRFDVGKEGKYDPGPGPFKVEYLLFNPFAVFDDELTLWSQVRNRTNIKISGDLTRKTFPFIYAVDGQVTGKRLELSFTASDDGWLKSVVVTLDEKIDTVLSYCDQLAATFLDSMSFFKQTPIDIYGVRISRVDSGQPVGQVMVIPYKQVVQIKEEDINNLSQIPSPLILLLRTFREAVNSTNPAYQLLCLWGIYERLKNKIRNENYQKLGGKANVKYRKPKRRVPDNELTRSRFARWIGKPYEEFLDFIENNFRDNIAHLVRKDPKAVGRDYALVQPAIETDQINCMQMSMIQQLILDEWRFMKENGLI